MNARIFFTSSANDHGWRVKQWRIAPSSRRWMPSFVRFMFCLSLLGACFVAVADCTSSLPLQGSVSIASCDSNAETCIPASEALYKYMGKVQDDAGIITVGLHTSPWRFYDGEMRILSVDEVAKKIRSSIKKNSKSVALLGSWTGVAPHSGSKSLAEKLSEALDGFPVTGLDGFLWINKEGVLRTTQQAFTVMRTRGAYYVAEDAEVMASLVAGWPAEIEEFLIKEGDANGIMRAGAGWDIFFLCPDRALKTYELAAELSQPIAAYNAAMMRIERGLAGDMDAATALLSQAAKDGDRQSRALLKKLTRARRD